MGGRKGVEPVADLISFAFLEGSFTEQMLSPYVYQHLGTVVTKELKVPPNADPVPWEIRTVNICDQYHTSRRVFPEISSCSQSQGTCASTAQAAWNPLVHVNIFPPPSVVRSSSYLFLEDTGTFY